MTNEFKLEILVLDDDEDFNLLATTQIKSIGHEVSTYKAPLDFFGSLKESLPDLCIIDLNIGDVPKSGIQVVRAIRNKIGNEIPLFITSAKIEETDKEFATKMGVTDFLSKPFKAQDLGDMIESHDIGFKKMHEEYLLQIPPAYSGGNLVLNYKIKEICENGITLASEQNIPKGTYISIKGDIISEALNRPSYNSTISGTNFVEATNLFHSFVSFDENDTELVFKVKSWLAKKIKEDILSEPEKETKAETAPEAA